MIDDFLLSIIWKGKKPKGTQKKKKYEKPSWAWSTAFINIWADATFPEEINREAVKEASYRNVLFSKYESQNRHPKHYAEKSRLSRRQSFPHIWKAETR